MFTWYQLHKLEPWGETRADLRAAAEMAVAAGVPDTSILWPYWEDPPEAEEVTARIAELKEAERRNLAAAEPRP